MQDTKEQGNRGMFLIPFFLFFGHVIDHPLTIGWYNELDFCSLQDHCTKANDIFSDKGL